MVFLRGSWRVQQYYMCLQLIGIIQLQSKDKGPGKAHQESLTHLSENPKWKMATAVAAAVEFYTHGIN